MPTVVCYSSKASFSFPLKFGLRTIWLRIKESKGDDLELRTDENSCL